jgi:hypothetical protein
MLAWPVRGRGVQDTGMDKKRLQSQGLSRISPKPKKYPILQLLNSFLFNIILGHGAVYHSPDLTNVGVS